MENSVDMTANAADGTLPTQVMPAVEETVGNQEPETFDPQLELDKLIAQRTGLFEIALNIDDLKWLKNQCNSKFSFKGPNDAFMLMSAHIGLGAAIDNHDQPKDSATTKLTASTVEALAMLVNKYEGTGAHAAHNIFKIAVALQNVIARFKEYDSQIDALEKMIKHQNEQPQDESAPEQEA